MESELENLGKLLKGIYLQNCTKAKEVYGKLSDEELLEAYARQKRIVDEQTESYRKGLSLLLNAIAEVMAGRGLLKTAEGGE